MRTFALNPRKTKPSLSSAVRFRTRFGGRGSCRGHPRVRGVSSPQNLRLPFSHRHRERPAEIRSPALMLAAPFRAGAGAAALRTKGTPRRPNKTPPRLRRVLPYDGARGCVLNAVCGAALRRGTYIRPCGCRCGWCRLRSRTSGPAGSSPFPRWRALSRWWRCCRRPRARRS